MSSDSQHISSADSPSLTVRRIAIGVEYNGAAFHGWQRQTKPPVATIQMALEEALSTVADQAITLICAGRTDAGVHATGQVAHFEVSNPRELKAWTMGVNSLLPAAIRVVWAKEVDAEFHARFSAQARRYQYWIHNSAVRPGIFSGLMTHYSQPLDEALMDRAAQSLVGEQDFTAFRAVACESKTPMRNVHAVSVKRFGERICIEIEANAFLLHMVRNITGTLMAVGVGKQPVTWVESLLAAKDRSMAAATAKPDGLYLVAVTYPARYDLPETERSLF
ncbi:tRNA pseudouridine(38-40) synthase TruA [Pseudomonadales bacterium]|nr:tRNA pseudouridine(38-40) synthase TruA [Pseudomonadales bacterium]MDG2078685.1 tRNA pseudouridine(38-40) synthase TruA [Pseudomonadales bacterium]